MLNNMDQDYTVARSTNLTAGKYSGHCSTPTVDKLTCADCSFRHPPSTTWWCRICLKIICTQCNLLKMHTEHRSSPWSAHEMVQSLVNLSRSRHLLRDKRAKDEEAAITDYLNKVEQYFKQKLYALLDEKQRRDAELVSTVCQALKFNPELQATTPTPDDPSIISMDLNISPLLPFTGALDDSKFEQLIVQICRSLPLDGGAQILANLKQGKNVDYRTLNVLPKLEPERFADKLEQITNLTNRPPFLHLNAINDIAQHPELRREILSRQRSQQLSTLKHEFLQSATLEQFNIEIDKDLEIGSTAPIPIEPRISIVNGSVTRAARPLDSVDSDISHVTRSVHSSTSPEHLKRSVQSSITSIEPLPTNHQSSPSTAINLHILSKPRPLHAVVETKMPLTAVDAEISKQQNPFGHQTLNQAVNDSIGVFSDSPSSVNEPTVVVSEMPLRTGGVVKPKPLILPAARSMSTIPFHRPTLVNRNISGQSCGDRRSLQDDSDIRLSNLSLSSSIDGALRLSPTADERPSVNVTAYYFGEEFLTSPVDACCLPGKRLAVSDGCGGLYWLTWTGDILHHIKIDGASCSSLTYSLIGDRLFMGVMKREGRFVHVYNASNFLLLDTFPCPDKISIQMSRSRWLCATPKGRLYAISGDNVWSALWTFDFQTRLWTMLSAVPGTRYQYLTYVDQKADADLSIFATCDCLNNGLRVLRCYEDVTGSGPPRLLSDKSYDSFYDLRSYIRSPASCRRDEHGNLLISDYGDQRGRLFMLHAPPNRPNQDRRLSVIAEVGSKEAMGLSVADGWCFVACVNKRCIKAIKYL